MCAVLPVTQTESAESVEVISRELYVTLDHKTSLKSLGYIVAIAKNTLHGSKLSISFYAKNH